MCVYVLFKTVDKSVDSRDSACKYSCFAQDSKELIIKSFIYFLFWMIIAKFATVDKYE